jgi:regulator of sigma E protease
MNHLKRDRSRRYGVDKMQMLLSFSPALIVFNAAAFFVAVIAIVFIHELGHFMVGRWCGVNIEAFSVGFGRELFGFNDKHGTRWKFCAIPLGGYVKFEGDANASSLPSANASMSKTSLQGAPLWKRALIVLAGPAANFILSILIFAAFAIFVGEYVVAPKIGTVRENSAASAAGLKVGDFIRVIDGHKITSFSDISETMVLRGETPILVTVERGGQLLDVTLTPRIEEVDDGIGGKAKQTLIGIASESRNVQEVAVKSSVVDGLAKGVERTWFFVSTTMRYIGMIFVGHASADQFHGPVGMAKMAGATASMGIGYFITFIGFISVSIGLVNLFPIPMLDGGHLVFFLIEGIMGKPVSPQAQEWSFRIGFSAILMLMIFVTKNDIFAQFTR